MSTSASKSSDLEHLHFSVVFVSDLLVFHQLDVFLSPCFQLVWTTYTYYPGHGQLTSDASMFCIYVFNHCATLRLSRFLNRISRDIFIVYVVKMLGHRTRCQDELLQHFGKNLPLIATETILPVGAFNHLKKMSRARKFVSISFSCRGNITPTVTSAMSTNCGRDCWLLREKIVQSSVSVDSERSLNTN